MFAKGKGLFTSIIGALIVLLWLGVWEYYYQTAPRHPVDNEGITYSINYHGTPIYLSRAQYISLYSIPVTGLILGIVSTIIIRRKSE